MNPRDLEALRATIPMPSQDGRVTLEEAEAVKSVPALSAEKVRAATFDLASTYTNEFVASRLKLRQSGLLRAIGFRPSDELARDRRSQGNTGHIILREVNACPNS